MQGEVGHLTVRVVDRDIGVRHPHGSCGGFPCHLGEDAVAFGEDCSDMAAHLIFLAELITGVVVEIGDALVIADVVDADCGVFRLYDVQFREMGTHLLILCLIDVSGKPHCSDKGTSVGGVAGSIDTSHRHKLVEPCAVILTVYPGYTKTVNIGAP